MSCGCNPNPANTANTCGTTDVAVQSTSAISYQPAFDLLQTDSGFALSADMPGARRDSISVTLERNTLRVLAKVPARTRERARTLREEYGVGDYHLDITLPEPVDAGAVNAAYEHGVLTINLPKPASNLPRRIAITGPATPNA